MLKETVRIETSWIVDERSRMVAVYPAPVRNCLCPVPPGTLYHRSWSEKEEEDNPGIRRESIIGAYAALKSLRIGSGQAAALRIGPG